MLERSSTEAGDQLAVLSQSGERVSGKISWNCPGGQACWPQRAAPGVSCLCRGQLRGYWQTSPLLSPSLPQMLLVCMFSSCGVSLVSERPESEEEGNCLSGKEAQSSSPEFWGFLVSVKPPFSVTSFMGKRGSLC